MHTHTHTHTHIHTGLKSVEGIRQGEQDIPDPAIIQSYSIVFHYLQTQMHKTGERDTHTHTHTHARTHTHTHTTVDHKYILVLPPVGTAESESVGEEMLLLKKEGNSHRSTTISTYSIQPCLMDFRHRNGY